MILIVALVFPVMQAGQGQDMLAQVAVAADLPLCRRQATRLITARESSLQEAAVVVGTKAIVVPMVAALLAVRLGELLAGDLAQQRVEPLVASGWRFQPSHRFIG